MRVADYIIERLYGEGVSHIFMITGRGALFLTDAVAKHERLQSISTHHEQAAAFAAMAYAQANGKLGACLVSTGCASTNTITGLLCSWQDDVPCVFISGQNRLEQTTRHTGIPLRTFGQQEADIVGIVEPLTKYATMITDPEKIAYEIDKAFYNAQSGRKGPVWIDVPLDVQNMRIEPEDLERYTPPEETLLQPSKEDIIHVKEALDKAERPVILLGSGIQSAAAVPALEEFLEKYPFPVTYAHSAVDAYGAQNKLSIGSIGSLGGTRAGNFTIQNSDLLIVIGCRLSTITTGDEYDTFARAAKVIVVDIDKIEHSKKTVNIDQFVLSDAKKFLTTLIQENITSASDTWIEKCLHWKSLFPKCEERYKSKGEVDLYYLGACLSKALPGKSVLLTDSGLTELVIPSAVSLKRGQRLVHPAAQGSMGYALPASIGAYFAHGKEIITVIGDGSIMMNLQELQTISHNKIPVKIFVLNNNVYATIRNRQIDLFRTRTIGTDPSNGVSCPNFQKVAECFELPYVKIKDNTNLVQNLKKVIAKEGPVLCEIMTVKNQIYLHNSFGRNSKGRIIRRPIEDQSPFLDRKLFLSEMIIEPVD